MTVCLDLNDHKRTFPQSNKDKMLSILALLLLAFWSPTAHTVSLGRFPVSITSAQLNDIARLDPFAPKPQHRTFMVSIFELVEHDCKAISSPYMPPLTAAYEDAKFSAYGVPEGTFPDLTIKVCQPTTKPLSNQRTNKVVLFSGALGTSRYLYSALIATVASRGYTIIAVDHPYDTDIVEFPSGKTIIGLNLTDEQIPLAVETRARDLSFVLDHLSRTTKSCPGRPIQAVAFSHSLGGAAAIAALRDPRILGALNLDGSVFGPAVNASTNKPVLLFGHDGKNRTTDPTWGELWPHLSGWKAEVELVGSAHYSFSDWPVIADEVFGGVENLPAEAAELIGKIGGERMTEILGSYVTAFLTLSFGGKIDGLLKGESKRFPEVLFLE
ncbi:PAF acetylhydrolase family protein [Mytilinidion resinicola]|uniref:1-alkyl-2-acetylglycerophosphocholine esterase n=1 Tax=Mytilinidion resinicola TaxID=574789 RepID=A0A6A6Z256_9PEZI|nr:PAF acetylhydrolase family protein [Mytilinidion resinicola]KAF2814888.1 PAF acetylhydrolase family protein [Mytilinidion resinicola]